MGGQRAPLRTRAARDSMNGWAQATLCAHALRFFFFSFFFFMNGGPEKSLTRDCWGRLLLLQGPSFFYKEGWRLLFLFFFFSF